MVEDMICRAEFEGLREDVREFRAETRGGLERVHDRIDCLAAKKSVSYPMMALVTVLTSSLGVCLTIILSRVVK